jgi:protein-tyrosine phosphatase
MNSELSPSVELVDLHCHLVPGVDDGARSTEDAIRWLDEFGKAGVRRVVTTPHLSASHVESSWRDRIERRYEELKREADKRVSGVNLTLSFEIRIDEPEADLSDPGLALGGGSMLVEFPQLVLPAYPDLMLTSVSSQGWRPVLAHPERYTGIGRSYDWIERWRADGVLLVVNVGSLLGEHGPEPERVAHRMLAEGHADCLASDHHGRDGRSTLLRAGWDRLATAGHEGIADLLMSGNPKAILAGEPCAAVPPVDLSSSLVKRLRRMVRGTER